jgi:conjugal transfer mating pair stabilization protein TraN
LHDGLNTFKIRVSVADEGEGYAFFDLEINTQNTYYCYSDYNFEHVSNNCTPSTSESLCTYWLTGPYDDTRGVCTRSAFYMNCVEESSRNVCQDWNEEIICNDQAVNLPNVTLENDIMDGFAESLGILGLLDDINSIWSGEYGKCSYGYFVDGFGGLYCNNCTGQGGFLCFETKPEQQKAYEMNKKGLCHYISTSCTNRIDMGFGSVCLENTRKYCCYDSKLARVIVEQSYSQLGKSWNSGCNGLTLDELNELDFGAMDFSEIEEDLENKINIDATYYSESMKDKIGDFYSDFTEEMDDRGVIDDPEN